MNEPETLPSEESPVPSDQGAPRSDEAAGPSDRAAAPSDQPAAPSDQATPPSPLVMALTFVYVLVFPALLFALAGNWRWLQGWIFTIWFVSLCYGMILYLYRHDPALLSERYRKPGTGGQQGWDRFVFFALYAGFLTWLVVMPLDAERFGWSPDFPWWLEAIGFAMLLGSSYFLVRVFIDNPFLSPLVRIQDERGQKVVTTGVYGIVRHPMYLGALLLFVGTPLLLGSVAGLVIGLAVCLVIAARIVGEEELLVAELDGYAEYRGKVRYRLIPRIW